MSILLIVTLSAGVAIAIWAIEQNRAMGAMIDGIKETQRILDEN